MKKIKKIIPIIIAFIIGISTTVGAATVFNSKDITYNSSATTKTNVKDSLDELYSKLGKCPEGKYCYTEPIGLSDKVELGDYISMTPTSTSYTISTSLTGYKDNQTINPSELNLWRVIRKNEDGTVDIVSEYVSSTRVYFYGKTGYLNLVGGLNTIASQYTNSNYVSKTRHMGYRNQVEKCTDWDLSSCPRDNGAHEDTSLVQDALGTLLGKMPNGGEATSYWLALRGCNIYEDENYIDYHSFQVNVSGLVSGNNLSTGDLSSAIVSERSIYGNIRPILTLKSSLKLVSGDGKSASTAYKFE